jgi:acylphosphatase
MLRTVSIIVTGKVQGVYYRQSAKEKARELNVTGEVRNMPDDAVYIVATGTEEQLTQLIEWCKQGPPGARVVNVTADEIELKIFEKFNIVR